MIIKATNVEELTFKDLSRRVSLETTYRHKLFERLKNNPFWIWDIEEHRQAEINTKGDCCFNHIIGLPTKERIDKPIFDYQRILYDTLLVLENHNPMKHIIKLKHMWVKKATGLGITEFFLRLMAYQEDENIIRTSSDYFLK